MTANLRGWSETDTTASALREHVRRVVAEAAVESFSVCDAWMRGHDPAFSTALARAGLIGLSWPSKYGGQGLRHVQRMVVTEELLRVGAPVAAHWIADRQIGPAILRYGSEELKLEVLPRISSGEVTFCLGMSETESGSDLAAVRTQAVRDGDVFRITGSKIWTSHAHRSTHAYVLARTGGGTDHHDGLTEFVVDLSSPGVHVRPIHDLAGEYHFNETVFDEVEVPAARAIGKVGSGWQQVTEQLAFERGGMERVLSSAPLLFRLLGEDAALVGDDHLPALGELVARLHTLRAMGHWVAVGMDAGEAPVRQAAMLKHLGTTFENDVVDAAREVLAGPPVPGAPGLAGLLASGVVAAPGATLRGGSTEVLLGIIGRAELPAAGRSRPTEPRSDVRELVDDVLGNRAPQDNPADDADLWRVVTELGWTGVGVPEAAGGSGGDLRDLAEVVRGMAAHGVSAPVAETAVTGRLLAGAGWPVDPTRPITLDVGATCSVDVHGRLTGKFASVPWAGIARQLLVAVAGEGLAVIDLDSAGVTVRPWTNLAGEPRAEVVLDGVVPAERVGDPATVAQARQLLTVLHSAALLGAAESAVAAAREHVRVREQFGRPLAAFQAVTHGVARMTADLQALRTAVNVAVDEAGVGQPGAGWRGVAARVVAGRTATAVARQAHQFLGAMGITREHELHRSTLRLWAWRDEHGSTREQARSLGAAAIAAGEQAVWDWIVYEQANLAD